MASICYRATNCDNAAEVINFTLPVLLNPLNVALTYTFTSPASMVDKCWTIEEMDCPAVTETIDLGSGYVIEGQEGLYDDQDYQWNVVSVPNGISVPTSPRPPASGWNAGTTTNANTPFPARVANQSWFPSYGTLAGGKWITFGQPDGSATCPSGAGCSVTNVQSALSPVTIYELEFNTPSGFVPELHLKFLIDNVAVFELNGTFLTPSNTPAQPWVLPYEVDVDAVNNTGATFNVGLNVLRAYVHSGSGSNGIAIEGIIENTVETKYPEGVPDESFINCDECSLPCYLLTDCDEPSNQIAIQLEVGTTIVDFSRIYTFTEYPDKCWSVAPVDCNGQTPTAASLDRSYDDCLTCGFKADLGEACETTPRLGQPGFSIKNYDPKKAIDIKTKFADSVYAQFKRERYGISTCCEFDLDKIDIKNQLLDLGTIYDPDMCVDEEPIDPCDTE